MLKKNINGVSILKITWRRSKINEQTAWREESVNQKWRGAARIIKRPYIKNR